MARIEYDKLNIIKCKCLVCPVQRDSQLARLEISRILPNWDCEQQDVKELEEMPEHLLPEPSRSPAVYCADSVCGASHTDLDFNQICACANCEVNKNHLLSDNYHCMNSAFRY